MSDAAMKRVGELILSAAPAYEMFLLQTMGKPFFLKLPLLHTTPERMRVTFESVETPPIGLKTPERLIMWVELNRSMDSLTVSTEYWQDIDEPNPTATSEAVVDATQENLLAPAFAFGWLALLVGDGYGAAEGASMESAEEGRMVQAEALIRKADEVLIALGYQIDAESYESYADTLEEFTLRAGLDEQTEDLFKKVGNVVRGAAHAYGAAKGVHHALKKRWGNFKASVKKSYDTGHDKSYKKWAGDNEPAEPGTAKHSFKTAHDKAKAAASGEPEKGAKGGSRIATARKNKTKSDAPVASGAGAGTGKGRYPGGKMSDDEYKKRYGRVRKAMAASTEAPDLDKLMDSMRDEFFEREFNALNISELEALEELVDMLHVEGVEEKSKPGSGERFKHLVGKLRMRESAVKDPAALAAWIGRKKYGNEKFAAMGKKGQEAIEGDEGPEPVGSAVSTYQRLSGLMTPMKSWSIYKAR